MPNDSHEARADAFAADLGIGLDSGICLACLSFVSMAFDRGEPGGVERELRRMTPDLWGDGLSERAIAAARRARDRGVAGADGVLANLEQYGGRSPFARAIVRRLAEELSPPRAHDDPCRGDRPRAFVACAAEVKLMPLMLESEHHAHNNHAR